LLTGIPDYFQFLTGGRRCCLAMITALDLRHKTKGSAVFGKYNQSFSLTGSECNRLITTLGGFDCEGMAGFTVSR
jgi:hypothetical protein